MNSSIKASILVRLVSGCIFVVLILIISPSVVFSALVGVMACFIPETYQGWKLSKTEKIYDPSKWLGLAYQSIISKWIMTAMIFALAFSSSIEWNYIILFIGYLFVHVFGLLTPILFKSKILKGKRKNVS